MAPHVKHVLHDSGIGVFLHRAHHVLRTPYDVILGEIYIPPEYSVWYADKTETNGIDILEQNLYKISQNYEDAHMMVLGNFDARTGEIPDYMFNDFAENLPCSIWYDLGLFEEPHHSCEKVTVNNIGKSLIAVCEANDLHIGPHCSV